MAYTFTRTGAQIEEIHNTVDNIYNTLGNSNLLSNHNFLIQTPDDSQPLPDSTPRSYPPGYQIFSGVFANETTGITNLTYIDGRVSFSGGDFYMSVPNTGALENITEFVASVADFDGKPRTRGVSYSLVGDEYRITVGVDALEDVAANPTPLGSVKFEQGGYPTSHQVAEMSIADTDSRYTATFKNDGNGSAVDNMIAGRVNGIAGAVVHRVGNVYSTGGTTWECKVDGASAIGDFTALNAVYVEDFGALGGGVTDDTSAFLASASASGVCNLKPNTSYKITALPAVSTLIVRGENSKIIFSNQLADASFDLLDISGVEFDAQMSDVTRVARVRQSSRIVINDVQVSNIDSSTFVRCFDISTQDVSISIENCRCENISALENGVVGDLNGSCRLIYIGDEDLVTVTTPSNGFINKTSGIDLYPYEDGDMIQIQSDSNLIFPIVISEVYGKRIAKRLVKVQVNGVSVSGVTCDAHDNAEKMFAIVSHYGENGRVFDVLGAGDLGLGVDTSDETTTVSDVNVINTGPLLSQSAGVKVYSGGSVSRVTASGFEHIVAAYISAGTRASTYIDEVRGSATGIYIYARSLVPCGELSVRNLRATTASSLEAVKVEEFASSGTFFDKVSLIDLECGSNTFYTYRVLNSLSTYVDSIGGFSDAGGSASQTILVGGGYVRCKGVRGSGNNRGVQLNATTSAIVENTEGATDAQVRTSGANNTVALNTITTSGIPALDDNFSNPSTNSQEIGTITLA